MNPTKYIFEARNRYTRNGLFCCWRISYSRHINSLLEAKSPFVGIALKRCPILSREFGSTTVSLHRPPPSAAVAGNRNFHTAGGAHVKFGEAEPKDAVVIARTALRNVCVFGEADRARRFAVGAFHVVIPVCVFVGGREGGELSLVQKLYGNNRNQYLKCSAFGYIIWAWS